VRGGVAKIADKIFGHQYGFLGTLPERPYALLHPLCVICAERGDLIFALPGLPLGKRFFAACHYMVEEYEGVFIKEPVEFDFLVIVQVKPVCRYQRFSFHSYNPFQTRKSSMLT
jgi:hypothetical protein